MRDAVVKDSVQFLVTRRWSPTISLTHDSLREKPRQLKEQPWRRAQQNGNNYYACLFERMKGEQGDFYCKRIQTNEGKTIKEDEKKPERNNVSIPFTLEDHE